MGSNLHPLTDRVVVLTNFICRTFLHIDMQKLKATTSYWYFYTLMVLNYSETLFKHSKLTNYFSKMSNSLIFNALKSVLKTLVAFSNSLIGISNHWSKLSHIFHDHPYRLCCLQLVCIHLHHQVSYKICYVKNPWKVMVRQLTFETHFI